MCGQKLWHDRDLPAQQRLHAWSVNRRENRVRSGDAGRQTGRGAATRLGVRMRVIPLSRRAAFSFSFCSA